MWKGVVQSSLDGKGMTVPEFAAYVAGLQFSSWRPSFGVLHNTAAPSLKQWIDYEKAHPGQRIANLERYYRDEQHWSAGPHAFIDNNFIWPFTPLTTSGVHSPSFNAAGFGIELVGDYDVEDDDTGEGYKAKRNAAACFGIICARLGIDPDTIKLHREDPRTTHKCPGDHIDKAEFIGLVKDYMGSAGEHDGARPLPVDYTPPQNVRPILERSVDPRVGAGGLNLREAASAAAEIVCALPAKQKVAVFRQADNAGTPWSYVWCRVNGTERTGWVASRYLL